jgi:plastocyanin
MNTTRKASGQRWGLGIGVLLALGANAAELQVKVQDTSGRALPNAVVFLESPAAKAAVKPQNGIEVAQVGRQFVPQVTVVPVGSMVTFPNKDTVRHHVYSFSPAKTFELKLYTGTPSNPVQFERAGVVVLGCNIHDSMAAWILAVETPYFAKTADTGVATLEGVVPGNYKLRAWHASLPPGQSLLEQSITISATNATTLITLKGATP